MCKVVISKVFIKNVVVSFKGLRRLVKLALLAYNGTLKLPCNYHNKHHSHIQTYHSPFHQHRRNGSSPIVFWQNGFLHGHSAVFNKTSYDNLRQGGLNYKKQL
jgi:hypothetical protein